MRLSEYPYVIVRVTCAKCARQGRYRLARLADRYGSEIELPNLLGHLAADCERRDPHRFTYDFCGAFFPDARGGPRPPDQPPAMLPAHARLKVVR